MAEETEIPSPSKPFRWRRIFLMLLGAVLLTFIGKAIVPNLAIVGQERIALVRIEGPILDLSLIHI